VRKVTPASGLSAVEARRRLLLPCSAAAYEHWLASIRCCSRLMCINDLVGVMLILD
jgi:hypothetical protein